VRGIFWCKNRKEHNLTIHIYYKRLLFCKSRALNKYLANFTCRFKQIFIKFITAVASHDHPLVLFIDDLQWADSSTLAMLSALLLPSSSSSTSTSTSSASPVNLSSATPVTHLLVLGAYRENEVSPEHPFVRMMEDVRAHGGCVQDLVLQPLGLAGIFFFLITKKQLAKK
jgi:hypothetical protein